MYFLRQNIRGEKNVLFQIHGIKDLHNEISENELLKHAVQEVQKINNNIYPFNRWKRIIKVIAEMKKTSNREERNEAFCRQTQGAKLTPEEGENIK